MSRPCASHVFLLIVLATCVSAQPQPQALNSSIAPSSTDDGHTESSISGQAVRSDIIDHGGLLSSVSTEQLAEVKAASGFAGSLEALAAHLHSDDDLVRGPLAYSVHRYIIPTYSMSCFQRAAANVRVGRSNLAKLPVVHSTCGCCQFLQRQWISSECNVL
jgi:hypothetical protein